MDSKRMFIAIDPPSAVKAELTPLQITHPDIKWAKANKLHITLYFLGNIETDQFDEVKIILEGAIVDQKPLPLKLAHLEIKNNQLIWIGVEDPDGRLQQINERLKMSLAKNAVGQKPDFRPYSPHLLLGKYRGKEPAEFNPSIHHALVNFKVLSFTIESISLYESILSPEGSEYIQHAHYRFGRAGPEPKSHMGEMREEGGETV